MRGVEADADPPDERRDRVPQPDELLEIRYEKIVADPVVTVRDICFFIGVDASPLYLERCETMIDRSGTIFGRNSGQGYSVAPR